MQRDQADANKELEYMLIQAIREGMTLGMTMNNVRLLASQLGINLRDVQGEK